MISLRYLPGALAVVGSNPTGPMSILSLFSPTSLDIIKLQGIMSDEKDEINLSNLRQITLKAVSG